MKKDYLKIIYIYFFFSFLTAYSQNEFGKWYFGNQAGLDFSTSPPTILTNGTLSSLEGCATVSDGNSNLLFYTNGTAIYNSVHAIMANGNGILGSGNSTQAAIIVKQPGNTNIYYVITTSLGIASNAYYSVVDMALAAGLGSVTVKNATLYGPASERQVAVKHCNGKDAWIVMHNANSNQFVAFILNSNGLTTSPVISALGGTPNIIGHLKISPDGKKLAMAVSSSPNAISIGNGGFHLFDFDPSTGIVTNSLLLLSATSFTGSVGAYGVEFSPDGSKLYGSTWPVSGGTQTCTLYQWNICAGNNAAIISSQYSISLPSLRAGSLQRAIDGKIYLAVFGSQSLGVINNPNANGPTINFLVNGLTIAPKISQYGLPNYINVSTPLSYSIVCQNVSFLVPSPPNPNNGCTSSPSVSSYLWDFGEPSSGSSNTSTAINPNHTYNNIGTYTISLISYGSCATDTLKKVIVISSLTPSLNITGPLIICKGAKPTFTVTGGTTYVWSNNATTSTISVSPSTTTIYTVTGTTNGCSVSKQFTVTVDPCTGIGTTTGNVQFSLFPNPVKELLSIESNVATQAVIFNINGIVVLQAKIIPGRNDINVLNLKQGVYFTQVVHGSEIWRQRLIKLD